MLEFKVLLLWGNQAYNMYLAFVSSCVSELLGFPPSVNEWQLDHVDSGPKWCVTHIAADLCEL